MLLELLDQEETQELKDLEDSKDKQVIKEVKVNLAPWVFKGLLAKKVLLVHQEQLAHQEKQDLWAK